MNSKYEIFLESQLHDYELGDISIDYNNKKLLINLISPKGKPETFEICNLSHFDISFDEPWSAGKYIATAEIVKNGDNYMIEIQLNSGDEIHIQYNE